jgi:hypothetical protein
MLASSLSHVALICPEHACRMRLLAERESDGILVRLYWDQSADPSGDIVLRYRDLRRNRSFTARPPRDRALHAFYHPNAYAPAGLLDAA